jgi:hypothetical protein
MNMTEKIKAQWNALSEPDKRLIRFYRQMDLEQILQRIQNFGDMAMGETNEKRKQDKQHQVKLYSIAYLLKQHKVPVKGGGKTGGKRTRRKRTRRTKKRDTRRR